MLLPEVQHTVAASSGLTAEQAAVSINPVAVVALLPRIHTAVAADGAPALGVAAVILDVVAVVTLFKTCLALLDIETAHPVAAE